MPPWTSAALQEVMAALRSGAEALRAIPADDLLRAWGDTVDAFLDPGSAERMALAPVLAKSSGLSPEGLAAGLDAVLGGVRRDAAARLFAAAGAPGPAAPVAVFLASNLPALAVQPLLPALALRRPVLLKSPSAEPHFAPAFLAALIEREPRLAGAVAALSWMGGARELEAPVLEAAGTVVAYGGAEALDDLLRRAPGKVMGYGPKTSLAVIGAEVDPADVADGLARDVALFDQRGCLSIAAVYTAGDAETLAAALAEALARYAALWLPGSVDSAAAAGVQQLRLDAELRGLRLLDLGLGEGRVVIEPRAGLSPSPGLRTVRVHPLPDLSRLPEILVPWAKRLQGAALAGSAAWALREPLAALGVSRFAGPGALQSPDASWHNGGVSPLAALGGGHCGIF